VRIKSQKDFFAGLLFVAIGIAFAVGVLGTKFKFGWTEAGEFVFQNTNYVIGSAGRMGPGYFPLMLGVLLAIIGTVVVFRALVIETPDGDPVGPWAWRPLLYIIAANFLFGILLGGMPSLGIPALGLIVAIVVLTIVAAKAGHEFKWREVIVLSVVLAVGSWVTFVWGLNLTFQVWPKIFGS
jgi:hypothetical protein